VIDGPFVDGENIGDIGYWGVTGEGTATRWNTVSKSYQPLGKPFYGGDDENVTLDGKRHHS